MESLVPKDWKAKLRHDPRTDKIVIQFLDGVWKRKTSPFRWSVVGDEAKAQALADRIERDIKSRKKFETKLGIVTVRSFGADWIKTRTDNSSYKDDKQRLEDYVYPLIGDMPIDEVRPRHLVAMVKDLGKRASKKGGCLAPKTVRHAYTAASALFHGAVMQDLIRVSPCQLRGRDLPKLKDKTPGWRDQAVFAVDEIEQLVLDARIPWDRRVFYAIAFLGCTRFGEGAALRWEHYDPSLEPLGCLHVLWSYSTRHKRTKETKQERPRKVPVTPLLARILAEWKLSGWPAMFGGGKPPGPHDLIVPSRGGPSGGKVVKSGNRSANHMLKKFHQDLARLKDDDHPEGLRERRQHDSRRTWLSMVLAAGANETHANWISHGPPPSVQGQYTTLPWATLCEVVEGLRAIGARKAGTS